MTYNKKGTPRRYRRVIVQGTASEATTLMGMLSQLLPESSRTTHKTISERSLYKGQWSGRF